MDFLDLKDISEQYIDLINPTSVEKVLRVGQLLELQVGERVIDFGCGVGEVLALWAEHFGIFGVGVDVREQACQRAKVKMAERGVSDRIEIVCADGADYRFEEGAFGVAACIGATFIWGGYRETLQAMPRALQEGGSLVVGEAYWNQSQRLPDAAAHEEFHTEHELLQIAWEEGFDVRGVVRASQDDWDGYESGNWRGLLDWIEANPDHPERQEVVDHLRQSQDEYFRYGREHLGWALYLLRSSSYSDS